MSGTRQPITLDPTEIGDICIPNISAAERRVRLQFGGRALVVAVVILVVLMFTGADRLWRLPLFLVFWAAAVGYFQWRDQTCVGLASTNSRKIGDQTETIDNPAELAQVKRQARRVQLKAFAAAVPLTLIALLLPVLG